MAFEIQGIEETKLNYIVYSYIVLLISTNFKRIHKETFSENITVDFKLFCIENLWVWIFKSNIHIQELDNVELSSYNVGYAKSWH